MMAWMEVVVDKLVGQSQKGSVACREMSEWLPGAR